MTLWEEKKRANAQNLIDWLLSTRTEIGGWPIDFAITVAFAELESSSPHSGLDTSVIMQILNEMSKSGKKSVEDFETIFEQFQKANGINANQKAGSWHFYIPIKVTINSDLTQRPRIRILGKDFSFISLSSVKGQLDAQSRKILEDPKAISIVTRVKIERLPEVFLSVINHASDSKYAWKEIEPAFNTLRGLIEMTSGFYRTHIIWGKLRARRKVPYPLWIIAYKKGIPVEWNPFITEEDNTTNKFDINNSFLTLLKKNATILIREPKPQSTVSLISDCLRLYSQAMDERFNHLCFLGFWQLAEAITHSKAFGGRTDKVVARIAWHGKKLGLKGTGYKETLLALGEKRNDIVHRGIYEIIKEDDINILKIACETALDWLFQVNESLPTNAHIEYYYNLREENENDLKAIMDCARYMGKQKSQ